MKLVNSVVVILLAATQSHAWEASSGAICTLTHETAEAEVRLTYDPVIPEYSITLTDRTAPWPEGNRFVMQFDGPRGNTITTDRHTFSDGGASLTVVDRGFGNVLDGLQFNEIARAQIDGRELAIPLDGAAGPVAQFRACASGASV